ncbi:helix-turn-helix transcriptional regulator [Myroides sp. LJL116]
MSKKHFIKRHFAIIECLRNGGRTFIQIQNYLAEKQNYDGFDIQISPRTFQRDCNEIATIWGVEIEFDRKNNYYHIVLETEVEKLDRFIEAVDVVSAYSNQQQFGRFLFLEKTIDKGTKYFELIAKCIKDSHALSFTLDSYWQDSSDRKCVPIAIKEAKGRFYLIGYDLDKKAIRNYALDRMHNVAIIQEVQQPIDFDVYKHYKDAIGIETYGELQKIVLRFDISQYKYLESLPIHSSQVILDICANGYEFDVELFVYPTHELKMEILKYGSNCQVIQPLALREEIAQIIVELSDLYSK